MKTQEEIIYIIEEITGVTLEDGEVLNADIVASNANMKTTVFDMVGPRHFEGVAIERTFQRASPDAHVRRS